MSARTRRTRLLAAVAISVATLTLTACNNGDGVHDEGGAAGSASTTASTASATPSPKASGGTSTGAGQTDSAGSSGSSGTSGSTGSTGSSGSTGSKGTPDQDDSDGSPSALTPCTSATRMTATVVSRPLNHLLLTVTNTGSKNCSLTGYPAVRFDEAQSVPPAFEDSKPQAVVTLAPGESGYASVLLSAADGSGSNGYTAKSLTVFLDADTGEASDPSLPAKGVYVDDSIGVSYWQSTMADALTW